MLNLMLALALAGAAEGDRQTVVVVEGASGTDEYGVLFSAWADRWKSAAERAGIEFFHIGGKDESSGADKQQLNAVLEQVGKSSQEPLWLVLIGHGTFDGRQAKFNLRGPDMAAQELADWLQTCERPLAVIDCSSSSGPFLNRLSGPNRVVVVATKSGFEMNFSRFGDHLSKAITETSVDLDKDEQVSLLEAFLAAAAGVNEFYEQEARLATEHALIDDTGDGLGTPADWFQGVRAVRTAKDGALPDGTLASQFCLLRSEREKKIPPEIRAERDTLEQEIERLRRTKSQRGTEEYYADLEAVFLKLARLYAQLEEKPNDAQ